MIKKIFFLLCVLLASGRMGARTMREVFAEMPDSVLELLTKNNRLDCIDFIENSMAARVRNTMGDYSELKVLNDSYLRMQLTAASQIEMKLLAGADSVQYICLVRTYAGPVEESSVALYTTDWEQLPSEAHLLAPRYEDLWSRPDTLAAEEWKEMLQKVDLRLMKATLSPDAETLEWTLQLDTLGKQEREAVQPFTCPLLYRWNATACCFE